MIKLLYSKHVSITNHILLLLRKIWNKIYQSCMFSYACNKRIQFSFLLVTFSFFLQVGGSNYSIWPLLVNCYLLVSTIVNFIALPERIMKRNGNTATHLFSWLLLCVLCLIKMNEWVNEMVVNMQHFNTNTAP